MAFTGEHHFDGEVRKDEIEDTGKALGAGAFGVFGVFGAAPFFESAGASSASSRQERAARIVTQGLPRVGAAASATK